MHLIEVTRIEKSNYCSILIYIKGAQLHSPFSFLICTFEIFDFISNCIFPNDGTHNKDSTNLKNYSFMKLDLITLLSFEDLLLAHI
jgi:hypothetical protein